MHVATYYGNVTLVLILLQHGGSPDITNVVSFSFIVKFKNLLKGGFVFHALVICQNPVPC